ncbi:MAG: HAD-IA family hydrolase [Actinobacteria bacterium]|nr:HAD-IA family hydrolase [Actinomycetota bacterium]
MRARAVIFDLGGVVMPSPIQAFREYEARVGLPHRFISEVIVGGDETSAWSQLERGELSLSEFAVAFEAECATAGQTVRAADMMATLQGSGEAHPAMLEAIRRIRANDVKTGALTNNWGTDTEGAMADRAPVLGELFDAIVESYIVGLRKPDPRIYELVCERLDVTPDEAVFLDDLGVNLKPARALGMTTIKVSDIGAAIAELEAVLGFPLASA